MRNNLHPSNSVNLNNLDDIFSYHDDPQRVPHYQAVRAAAKQLAETILVNCPSCADTSTALRRVREAVMNANAAIALAPNYDWVKTAE